MENLSIQDINLIEWHSNREVPYAPRHFIYTRAPVTPESIDWIKNNLVGRYSLVNQSQYINDKQGYSLMIAAFEDPSEATFYELTWS